MKMKRGGIVMRGEERRVGHVGRAAPSGEWGMLLAIMGPRGSRSLSCNPSPLRFARGRTPSFTHQRFTITLISRFLFFFICIQVSGCLSRFPVTSGRRGASPACGRKGAGAGSGNNIRNKMRRGEQRAGLPLGLATRLTWDLVELVPV